MKNTTLNTMNSTTLFSMSLGLQSPWQVSDVSFASKKSTQKELHLHIGFSRGTRFPDEAGVECTVHDTVERKWQHLNFLNIIVFYIVMCLALTRRTEK